MIGISTHLEFGILGMSSKESSDEFLKKKMNQKQLAKYLLLKFHNGNILIKLSVQMPKLSFGEILSRSFF